MRNQVMVNSADVENSVERVNRIVEKYAPAFSQMRKIGEAFQNELASAGVLSVPATVLYGAVPGVVMDDVIESVLDPIEELERRCDDIEKSFHRVARIANALAWMKEASHA